MKNKRRILGIVAALLLAVVGTVSLMGYVRSSADKAAADEQLVEVYVIDDFVAMGADADAIRAAVAVEEVPARLVQDGAITDLDDIGDEVAAADLQPGDQLLGARLVSEDLIVEEVDDKVQIAARLDVERAVGGAIEEGDLVGVYISFDPFNIDESGAIVAAGDDAPSDDDADETVPAAIIDPDTGELVEPEASDEEEDDGPDKTPNVSRLEFQHVLVTGVQTVSKPNVADEDTEDASIAQVTGTQYVVTLALSPEESERFVFASEFGHIWLSIEPATVQDDGTRPVTLTNVYSVVD